MEKVLDKDILKRVNEKLSRAGGGSNTKVSATVRQGDVTVSGTLQYEMQRQPLIKAATSVPGVRRVIDQLQVNKVKRV
jgi:osmotically-inducible protein OsmY